MHKQMNSLGDDTAGSERSSSEVTRRQLLQTGAAGAGVAAMSGLLGAGSPGIANAATTANAGPRKGGTLRIGAQGGGSAETLDPRNLYAIIDYVRAKQVYETLTRINAKGALENWLAEEFIPNHNATEWTIRLRKGIKFQNGKPFGADDVIWTLRYSQVGGAGGAGTFTGVNFKGIKKLDAHTVLVPLERPISIFPQLFSDNYAGVYAAGTKAPFTHPIGTGPFSFVSWQAGQSATYKRFDEYWGGPANLDSLEIVSLADPATRGNALTSGQIDLAVGIDPTQVAEIKANPNLAMLDSPSATYTPLYMWTETAPFSDVRVRQALRLLINREEVVKNALAGFGRLGNDLSSWFDPDYASDLPQRVFDPEKAKSLLKQAGHADLHVTLKTSNVATGAVSESTLLAGSASAGGATIKLSQVPATSYWSAAYQHFPFGVSNWIGRPVGEQMFEQFVPKAPLNETQWNNPKFNSVFSDVLKTTSEAKRHVYLQDAQTILYNEGGYIIPAFPDYLDASSSKVHGVTLTVAFELDTFNFHGVWLG
jgi:peptide/nickel transport system substrate-binding protein